MSRALGAFSAPIHLQVRLDQFERRKTCRAMLEAKIKAHEIMYGVNTGIGEFSEVVLNDEQVKDFQRYLIYNHEPVLVIQCRLNGFVEQLQEE